jgi:hypothetical protein
MKKTSYALNLFYLLQKRKKASKDNPFDAAKGLIFGIIISLALWFLIISIGLVIL